MYPGTSYSFASVDLIVELYFRASVTLHPLWVYMHMKVRQHGACILIGRKLHVKFIKSSKCLNSNSVMTNTVHSTWSFNTVPVDMNLSYLNTFLSSKFLNIFYRRCECCTAGSTISRTQCNRDVVRSTASSTAIKEISYVATAHLKFYTFFVIGIPVVRVIIYFFTKILEPFLISTILNIFLLILHDCKSSLCEVLHSYHLFRVT